jgi:hypothetical protein
MNSKYKDLFSHLREEYGLLLLESEKDEIVREINKEQGDVSILIDALEVIQRATIEQYVFEKSIEALQKYEQSKK